MGRCIQVLLARFPKLVLCAIPGVPRTVCHIRSDHAIFCSQTRSAVEEQVYRQVIGASSVFILEILRAMLNPLFSAFSERTGLHLETLLGKRSSEQLSADLVMTSIS